MLKQGQLAGMDDKRAHNHILFSTRHALRVLLLGTCLLTLSLSGCAGTGAPNPTAQVKIASFSQTATVRASGEGGSKATAQTARLTATVQGQARAQRAAQTIAATQDIAKLKATATAQAPIIAELPFYGVNPSGGHVGWIHPPVTLYEEEYRQAEFANQFPTVIAKDFVMVADILWDTKYGSSGCGFVLRSDGDVDTGSMYMVVATRVRSGHVIFAAVMDGKIANADEIYANGIDPNFDWQNNTTNRLAVVARDHILTIYTNRVKIGEIDTTKPPPVHPKLPPKPQLPSGPISKEDRARYDREMRDYQDTVQQIEERYKGLLATFNAVGSDIEQGFVGMIAVNGSGYTRCTFQNAWLWMIDD